MPLENTQLDLENPTILAALEVSKAAYDKYGTPQDLITGAGGWIQITGVKEQEIPGNSYQGVAFYRVVNEQTEVIIGNRGSQSFHDFTVSDALLAINATPPADTDALNYYNAVVEWLKTNSSKLTGSVQIIETGHSLGGQEADYVLAFLADGNQETVYSTSAITFDAPGLSTSMVKAGADYNALNISLGNEGVHVGGSLLNAGYLGSSITIGGGLNPIAAGIATGFIINPALGVLAALVSALYYNHVTGRLTNYFADTPALGGVNLSTYRPTQVTQGAADALSKILAKDYNSMSASDLVTLYQSLLKNSASSPGFNNSFLKELFTVETTSTGCTLHGSGNDTITMTFSGNQEIVTDNHGNQVVLTFNSLGTELVTATYSVGDPTTGTINFSPDGSSTQTMTYNSGAYATITDDGFGNVTTDYYSKSGVHYASDWIHSDGTSGTYEVVPNGVVGVSGTTVSDMPGTTQVVNPDGSYSVITRDASDKTITYYYKADGSFASQTIFPGTQSDYDQSAVANTTTSSNGLTTYFDSHGNKLHDTWTASDGATGTDTFHASGEIEGTKQNTNGSRDTYTVYGASGTPNTQTFIASPVATYTYLRGDDFTRTHFNADGSIASDVWQLNDGASGQDNFTNGAGTGVITHADGSKSTLTVNATGNIIVDNLDSAGQKASEDQWNSADGTHSVTVFDAGGFASEKFTYLTNGKVVSTVFAADGSVAQTNTLNAGQVLNPDGSRFVSTSDPNGGYDIDYWDANGDVTVFKYSAGVLQNVDHVSVSDLCAQTPSHNAYTSQYTQDDGTKVTVYLDAGGHSTGSDWTKPDGSHGADILNSDGTKTGVKTLADGSSTTYEEDAAGNLTNESYDANGFLTSDLWKNTDGTHGFDLYNADGSSSGRSYAADGSYSAYNDDGKGNNTTADYDASDKLLDDQWQKADGTAGSDIHNADGSSSGSVSFADLQSATYTNDGKGDTKQTYFDAQGTKTDDVWAKADGSHGWDNFFSTGASSGAAVNADGSYSTYTDDGQGHVVTVDYDANGHVIAHHGGGSTTTTTPLPDGSTQTSTIDSDGGSSVVISNPDGSSSGTTNHADGSYTQSTTNAFGETVTEAYDWQGKLTGTATTQSNGAGNTITTWRDTNYVKVAETFTRADGTSGVDHVSALDYIGELNLAPPLAGGAIYYTDWGLPSWDKPAVAWSRISVTSSDVSAEFQLMPGWDPSVPAARFGGNTLELSEGGGSLYRGDFEIYDPATGADFFGTQSFDGSKTVEGDNGFGKVWTQVAPTTSTPLTGTVAGFDGTSSTFTDDGQGNGQLVSYDASGRKIDDIWWHNDGSLGADRFLADGTSTGLSAGPDGKFTTYTADAQGHVTSSHTGNGTSGIQFAPPSPPVVHVTLPTMTSGSTPPNGSAWAVPDLTASDGNGGTYTVHFSAADGSAHAVHRDSAGNIVNDATVDTDPGYSATASAGGTVFHWRYDAQGRLTSRTQDDGAGTVTTEQIDPAGGVSGRTVSVTDAQGNIAASSYDATGQLTGTSNTASSDANGITTTTTFLFDAAGNASGSTVVVDDGQGNTVTTQYDAAGAVKSSTQVKVVDASSMIATDFDGAGHAIDAFTSNVNAQGVVQTSMYDGAGNLTGTVVATPDAAGNITTTNYDAGGNLTSYVVLTQDAQGDSVFDTYDAQGHHLRENIVAANGEQTSTVFDADGSSRSTRIAADGSYSVTTVDAQGDTVTSQFSVRNVKLSDAWKRTDGSSGTDTFHTDGTSSGTATYADGTHASIVTGSNGDVTTTHFAAGGNIVTGSTITHRDATKTTTTNYDGTGAKLADHWLSTDGSSGTDTWGPGGAYSKIVNHADGSKDTTSNDGKGNSLTQHRDAPGKILADSWSKADGSSGSDVFNADGSTARTTNDGHGNTLAQYFDASGTLLGDRWSHADGSTGNDFFGSYSGSGTDAGGMRCFTNNNGQGDFLMQHFDAGGKLASDSWSHADGSWGHDTYAADGSYTGSGMLADGTREAIAGDANGNVVTKYFDESGTLLGEGTTASLKNPDGTRDVITTDRFGDVITQHFDASGTLTGDRWTHVDGSDGADVFNVDASVNRTANDGHGNTLTQYFDPYGRLLGDRWAHADGTSGSDSYMVYENSGWNPDGTRYDFRNDGLGGFLAKYFDSSGTLLRDTWTHADGSYGSDAFYADGAVKHTAVNPDGSESSNEIDAQGHPIATYNKWPSGDWSNTTYSYDTDGFKKADTFETSSGSHGSHTYSRDGTWSKTAYMPDGTRYDTQGDDKSDTWSGTDGTHGSDYWDNAGGWGLSVSFNADGSSSTNGWSNDGNFNADYDSDGRKLDDSWSRQDGSSGTTTYNSDGTISGSTTNSQGVTTTFDHVAETLQVAAPLQAHAVSAGDRWSFVVPDATFRDADAGEFFQYSATLANGDPLPSWLAFDAHTHTFDGTVPVGTDLVLKVCATNSLGLKASSAFILSADGVDHAPVVVQAIDTQSAGEQHAWSFLVPAGTFADADAGDTITYTASLASGAALPAWIAFDASTGTFTGTPPLGSAGTFNLLVVATDSCGQSANTPFTVTVAPMAPPPPPPPPPAPTGITLVGTSGKDSLTGTSGDDILKGLAGNDVLNGGTGADTMIGGAGNDTYIVDNPGDIVTEAAGDGTDTVLSSISYTLAPNVENLTLTGHADLVATGNDLANTITANSGNDTLVAGAGIAKFIGGAGSDTFVVNNTADIVKALTGGNNTVLASVSYVAPANVHNLTGTGSANIVLSGGKQPVVITGNAGIDVLEAGTGKATLSASAAAVMMGNKAADTITAGAGAAFIDAGAGADTVTLGSANSVVAFNRGDGVDTIIAGSSTGNTLSLGGGIAEGNLLFTKSGDNLVLNAGGSDTIVFKNWYSAGAVHEVSMLQVIEQVGKVETFDFAQLVSMFDQARAQNPALATWKLANGLLAAHTGSSDTAALGGNLAYWDGMHGSLKGMDVSVATAAIADGSFGHDVQIVGSWTVVSQGGHPLA
jgi:YD repeat-containing protein